MAHEKPIPWHKRKREDRKIRISRRFDIKKFAHIHLDVRSSIKWQELDGTSRTYSEWSNDEKEQLQTTFDLIFEGGLTNLPEAPKIIGGRFPAIGRGLEPSLAWNYYIAYVAQSLAVEIGSWVPWSFHDYDYESRSLLFDSRSLFIANEAKKNYTMGTEVMGGGGVTIGDPVRIYEFLEKNRFVGNTRIETLENLFGWCTDNLFHAGFVPAGTYKVLYYWQYDHYTPVERIISGTYRGNETVKKHWTGSCWGTTGFLKTVLRTINMPVKLEQRCGHALPSFLTERNDKPSNLIEKRYLSHGDDLYNGGIKPSSLFPRRELLLNQETFDSWFGPSVSATDVCNNIGRGTFELALEHLNLRLLRYHCDDVEQGKDHANSSVYKSTGFSKIYTVEALEMANLWERIEQKISDLGGCQNIPRF